MENKIAIVGMSMRCAEAQNIQMLHNNLIHKVDSVKPISEERIKSTSIDKNRSLRQIGYIEDIDKFDYRLFGLSKAEASVMDPHHRLLLEVVYEAINNSGYSIDYFDGSESSVYLTDINPEYYKLADKFEDIMIAGNSPAFSAARVARHFNLLGNAMVIDTACSSSLVALHTACNELILGQADYAFVGGANLNFFPYCDKEAETSIWSSDGKSRAFSEQADGMSCGETVACLILKRLPEAISDKDNIHAVVLASAVNNNANRSASPSAPDSISQANVITSAWENAGINPCDIGFIEAHGSGTKLGDTLEVEGLTIAFNKFTNARQICPISTIKSNIGHSYSVSGIAGVIKAVLSLKNGIIYPSLHVNELNHMIDFENSAVYIETKEKEWKSQEGKKRIAAVTSLGASGTNCHVVLQEAPKKKEEYANFENNIIALSNMTETGLHDTVKFLIQYLDNKKEQDGLYEISCNLNIGRHHYSKRAAFVAKSCGQLKELLLQYLRLEKVEDMSKRGKRFYVLCDVRVNQQQLEYCAKEAPQFARYYKECLETNKRKVFNEQESSFIFVYAMAKMLQTIGISMSDCICIGVGRLVMNVIQQQKSLGEALEESLTYVNNESKIVKDKFRQLLMNRNSKDFYIFTFLSSENFYTKSLQQLVKQDNIAEIMTINDNFSILSFVARLYEQGANIEWHKWYDIEKYQHIELPGYVFSKERCWIREGTWIEKNDVVQAEDMILSKELNVVEQYVLDSWRRVIGYNQLDITKNFFECGGDSLKATNVIRDIEKNLGVQLDFEDVFDFPTVESLSQYILENIDLVHKIMLIFKNILKVDELDGTDSFFDLGGHSLMANQLLVQLQRQIGIALDFEDVFNHPSAQELAEYIENSASKKNIYSRCPIEKAPEMEYYSMSEVQKQLWVMSKLKNGSSAYNSPFSLTVAGKVDENLFKGSVLELVKRHESLRTIFVEKEGEVYQHVISTQNFVTNIEIEEVLLKEQAVDVMLADMQKEFDLEKGPLFRCKLIYFSEGTIIYFNIHHIIFDGWSSKVFLNDFIQIYDMLFENKDISLTELEIQYKDYSEWQNLMLDKGLLKEAQEYWLEVFRQKVKPINLCIAKRRPMERRFVGDKITKIIGCSNMVKIKEFCNTKSITLYMYLLAALNTLIYLYSGEKDIVIGTPIAGRNQAALENQIGYYANTIAIRNYVEKEEKTSNLLTRVKSNVLNAFKYQDYPFARLVSETTNKREGDRNSLFDIMMVLQNTDMIVNQNLEIGSMKIIETRDLGISSLFDLHIEFQENECGMEMSINYDVDLFQQNDVKNFADDFIQIVNELMDDEIKIKDISLRNLTNNKGISNWEMDNLLEVLNDV